MVLICRDKNLKDVWGGGGGTQINFDKIRGEKTDHNDSLGKKA